MKAYRGNRGIALLILNLGARWEMMLDITPQPLSLLERNPVLLEQEVWCAPFPVWTICTTEKPSAFAGIRNAGSSSAFYSLILRAGFSRYNALGRETMFLLLIIDLQTKKEQRRGVLTTRSAAQIRVLWEHGNLLCRFCGHGV